MAKITLPKVVKFTDVSIINENFSKIAKEFQDKTLYRNNPTGEPNSLATDIDANGKRIYNLPRATSDSQAATLADVKAYANPNVSVAVPTWGAITGNISAQPDLVALVGTKQDKLPASGNSANVLYGDLTWRPAPTGGSGGTGTVVWGNVGGSISNQTDLKGALDGKEPAIPAGSASQYVRGNKTVADLNKGAVGLGNVDNTSDLSKPVSTAMATALAGKEAAIPAGTAAHYITGAKTLATLNKAAVGLANVDNTTDVAKPVSNATAAALSQKEPLIPAGGVGQYLDGTKTWKDLPAGGSNSEGIPIPITAARASVGLDSGGTLVMGNTPYTISLGMPTGFHFRAVPPRSGVATFIPAAGVTLNYDTKNVTSVEGSAEFMVLLQIAPNSYLFSNVTPTQAEVEEFFPNIGPDDYWFHPDSTRVTYANRATLQSVVNNPAIKYIRLDAGDYAQDITIPSDKVIIGIPSKTKLNSKRLAFGASRVVIKGIEGELIVDPASGVHTEIVHGVAPKASLLSTGTMDKCLTLRTFSSTISMDNSVSGSHTNMRLINPHWQGGADGYENVPGINIKGRAGFRLNTITAVGLLALTPRSSTVSLTEVENFRSVGGGMERGPEHFTNGTPVIALQDCGYVLINNFDGYDPANKILQARNIDRLDLNFVHCGTGGPVWMDIQGVKTLTWLPTTSSGVITDDGLPGTTARPRLVFNGMKEVGGVDVEDRGIRYNGTLYNTNYAKLTGSDIAAASAIALNDDGYQYQRWARVKERPVADMLGPNWQAIAAAAPDETAALQALINARGQGGTYEFPANKIYYISDSLKVPKDFTMIGSGQANSGIVMKNQTKPMFTDSAGTMLGFIAIGLTFQGGKQWILSSLANVQFTQGYFLYCTIRDQAEAAMDLLYTYGWDNVYCEGVNFVRCGAAVRSLGRASPPTGGVPGETQEMAYFDKLYLARCQFIECKSAFDLKGTRLSGGFLVWECGFFRGTDSIVTEGGGVFNNMLMINSLVKDCAATTGEKILFAGAPSPASCYVGVTIDNPSGNFLFKPGSKFEGLELIKGGFTGKAFWPQVYADPRVSTIENSDFGSVPTGITQGTLSGGVTTKFNYILINTRTAAAEDANWNKMIGMVQYDPHGNHDVANDTMALMPGWCDDIPHPGSRICRDRVGTAVPVDPEGPTTPVDTGLVSYDPANKSTLVTLSENNSAMTSSQIDKGVRSLQSITDGNYYFEVAMDANGIQGGIGLANSSETMETWTGRSLNSVGLDTTSGDVYSASAVSGTSDLGTIVGSDVIGVAVNMTARKMWFSKNGAFPFGQDPVGNAGGFAIPAGTTMYAMVSANAGAVLRIRTLASQFTGAIPSGYTQYGRP